jgi:TPR repeat protein
MRTLAVLVATLLLSGCSDRPKSTPTRPAVEKRAESVESGPAETGSSQQPTVKVADAPQGRDGSPPIADSAAASHPTIANLTEGCEDGDAAACGALGHAHLAGEHGLAVDPARALELLQRGCFAGDGPSCADAARLIVARDRDKADRAQVFYLGQLACSGGSLRDCGVLLKLAASGREPIAGARERFEEGCDAGDPRACHGLAGAAQGFYGGPRDIPKARATLEALCTKDVPYACHDLAFFFHANEEPGHPADHVGARRLFDKACKKGWNASCRMLARMGDAGK